MADRADSTVEATRGVRRLGTRPIVEAGAIPGYGPLFNAGLVHHEGRYHLFVRAVRDGYRIGDDGGPRFVNYVSDIVVFTSTDGLEYEYGYVLALADEGMCFEDPRVQWVRDRAGAHLVMTYTRLASDGSWRIGAHRLQLGRRAVRASTRRALVCSVPRDLNNKDAVVFTLADGRVALIHRIHPDMQLAVFDDVDHLWDAADDYWDDHVAALGEHTILTPTPGALGIGAGAPPVSTHAGLLLFFHERRADGVYTMNVALLDATTGRLLSRLAEPVLEPELDWERRGDVDDVVFVQGAHLDGDEVYLTYGAADRCVGAAVASVSQILEALGLTEDEAAA